MYYDKETYRKELKAERAKLSPTDLTYKSLSIQNKLLSLINWSHVKILHYYTPMSSLKEPDIMDFIINLKIKYPEIELQTTKLIDKKWQVVKDNVTVKNEQSFDVIIVPMLGFDGNLNRLGYGGGFYDRFLATQQKATKVGICLDAGKVNLIPVERHDVPLNIVVTESKVYR